MQRLEKENLELLSLFNENRLLILRTIYRCKDKICACNLVEQLNISKHLVSYHIKELREMGYLEEVRCGKNKVYQISSNKMQKVKQILKVLEII